MQQINLDLITKIRPSEDTKEIPLSFRAGEKFRDDLDEMAKAKGMTRSELIAEYVIIQYSEDYKKLLLLKQKERKTVRELMDQS